MERTSALVYLSVADAAMDALCVFLHLSSCRPLPGTLLLNSSLQEWLRSGWMTRAMVSSHQIMAGQMSLCIAMVYLKGHFSQWGALSPMRWNIAKRKAAI